MAAAERSAAQQRLIALLGPAAHEYLERLADSPYLRLVSALRFDGACVPSQGLKALAASPHAGALRTVPQAGKQEAAA